MPENASAAQHQVASAGDPSPQTCLQVARQAAILAVTAADDAMTAVCHSRSGAVARLEAVMHATHKEAVEADRYADRAEQWADDPTMPSSALLYCAREAVDHAVRAQSAAGVDTTATDLRAELERKLTAAEYAERETERRRAEAEREAEERAATGMDADNRDRAARNRYLAEGHVAELGWTAGHVRVLEAAESGRLYWRDGRARQAARHGVWTGGRRVSRERTHALFAARFLVAVRQEDGTRVLTPTPMGQVALELARLHPAGLHDSDRAAYEARFARVRRRHKRRDDQKAAARRLPPLDSSARKLYRKPLLLTEQEARAERDAVDGWEDEGGYCPGTGTPRPAASPAASTPPVRIILSLHRHTAVQPALW
ncbi:hypothetical protein [Streptomyces scabiei]|uniref:hypothetical protein n=1 Tax=Streptomyces scabiei TaxID=1930 RepID=UPI0029BAEDF8|nr:hypothetical protein [Streptomyces scabiei]MDX2538826.1 hypothetical protein [Streptomyces scabiei]MDX2802622.1 hypothetical protein [Streptomyces scabiei]MDX2859146.1 hypothetical protein [Streptomyces scabiei]MDX3828984.1 hypothetical protein [Streptomyces scabiei]